MITSLGAAGAAASIALLVRALVGSAHVRGVLLTLALVAISIAGGPSVPDHIRSAALLVTVAFLAVALVLPGSKRFWDARSALLVVLYGGNVAVTTLASPDSVSAVIWVAGIAILATGVAIRCSPRDRAVFLTGLVGLALVQTALAAYETFMVGRPVFWDYAAAENSLGVLPNPLLGVCRSGSRARCHTRSCSQPYSPSRRSWSSPLHVYGTPCAGSSSRRSSAASCSPEPEVH
ncbi:hypothetical protein P9139_06970 [Curtobacterium flaccumfaciens]|nr:hypothetical protein P9139_06970 [Curtobacterium flaccumfaciens]